MNVAITKKLGAAEFQLTMECTIQEGTFTCLVGPSGSGKTTFLKIVAGLLEADAGVIHFDGHCWFDKSTKTLVPAQKRNIGYVFQEYAVFPNMTVEGNMDYAFGKLKNKTLKDTLVSIMELQDLLKEVPGHLSGGQKQRVALAMALCRQPKLLLLDEPLGALDHAMRSKMQQYISEVHKKYKLTTIMVTHDIAETYILADKVIQLDKGSVVKEGTADQVYGTASISGKFSFNGVVVDKTPSGILHIITVLINNEACKVVVTHHEANFIEIGDKVRVASKAFNPVIQKIN